MNQLLENLNNQQIKAVKQTEGSLLVLSGAGTGKTRVLIARTKYILDNNLAKPWQIMLLTFTNKAANEIKNRLIKNIDSSINISDLWVGTFHSICLKILRANFEKAGLNQNFIILGEDEQKTVIKSAISNMNLDPKGYDISGLIDSFSLIKDKGLNSSNNEDKIFQEYNKELKRLNAIDFGDIIIKVIELFNLNPSIAEKYQKQFKYIMVDEFQDTNISQYEFLKKISSLNKNICCVGDDDQSIYSWRGAEIKNMLDFSKHFENTEIIRLETNYRSTKNILGVANSLISNNKSRLGKTLNTSNDDNNEKVYIVNIPTDKDEAKFISKTILDNKFKLSDTAILIRNGSLSRVFEEEFTRLNIPYRLIGTIKFYERAEIRDVIAYIRLLVYPFDDISFTRIISKPSRGIGESTISKLRELNCNYMQGLSKLKLSKKQIDSKDSFLQTFDFDWKKLTPKESVKTLLERSGYLKFWEKNPDLSERLNNINDLVENVIPQYETLESFLENASLMMIEESNSNNKTKDCLSIMSIHASKGLEFDNIFLPAFEEGIIPNEKSVREGSIEEERRLAYVAITRAKKRLIITNCFSRFMFGKTQYNNQSRFLNEIDYSFTNLSEKKLNSNYQNNNIVGRYILHKEMGKGLVLENNSTVLTVYFSKHGIKKVLEDFVKIID